MAEKAPVKLDGLGAVRVAAREVEMPLSHLGRGIELLHPCGIGRRSGGDIGHGASREPLRVALLQIARERERSDFGPRAYDDEERRPPTGPRLLASHLEPAGGGVIEGNDRVREIGASQTVWSIRAVTRPNM
jgi:hypothetical protein